MQNQNRIKTWDELLDLIESDQYLGARGKTGNFTRQLIKQRKIRAIMLGGRSYRIRRSELDRYLKACETTVVHT